MRRHKRRRKTSQLLQALREKHAEGAVYVAWNNATTRQDEEVAAVVRGAAGRMVLVYLPTYGPWVQLT